MPIFPDRFGPNPVFSTVTLDKLIVDKDIGEGIKVDKALPTFGWQDLLGRISVRGVGGQDPTFAVYRSPVRQFRFNVNDECWLEFHIPHDHLPNSDVFLHAHWSLASAGISENITWGFDVSYSKGHGQGAFTSPVNILTAVTPTSTTQYQHIITEVQATGVGKIDKSILEPDGLILCRTYLHANSGVTPPFLHFADLHYQTTNIGTKQKSPDFYV